MSTTLSSSVLYYHAHHGFRFDASTCVGYVLLAIYVSIRFPEAQHSKGRHV